MTSSLSLARARLYICICMARSQSPATLSVLDSSASMWVGLSTGRRGQRRGSSRTPDLPPLDRLQSTVLPGIDWFSAHENLKRAKGCEESRLKVERESNTYAVAATHMLKQTMDKMAQQHENNKRSNIIRKEREMHRFLNEEQAKHQAQKRQEAIDRANNLLFHQTPRVRSFDRAKLLDKVLAEREAQIELKRQQQIDSERREKEDRMAGRLAEEASKLEQQKALEKKKQERIALNKTLRQQMEEHKLKKAQEVKEARKGAEEQYEHRRQLLLLEQAMLQQQQQEKKMNFIRDTQKQLADNEHVRAREAEKQYREEAQRIRVAEAQEKEEVLRKEERERRYRESPGYMASFMQRWEEAQRHQEQERISHEEKIISKVEQQAEAKWIQQQREKDQKKAAMLESIAAHRQAKAQEKERKEQEEKLEDLVSAHENEKAARIFKEEQQLRKQKMKDDVRAFQDANHHQIREKREREERLKEEERNYAADLAQTILQEETQFQHYAQDVIQAARSAHRRKTDLLPAAARKHIGKGLGPIVLK